jgi:hypothetical protein
MKMTRGKKNMGRRRRRKATGRLKARRILARNGTRTARHPTLMMKDSQPRPSTNPLFPNERHTCLMAKEKKVSVRETPKYTTSSDDDSSDDEVDYSSLFKGLDRAKVEKINELIDALNEKDRLLERQEDILRGKRTFCMRNMTIC